MTQNAKFTNGGKYLELIARAVASGSTVKAAAADSGCSESHAYRVSSSDQFRQRVYELRSEITSEAMGKLTAAATQAVDTLTALLAETSEPSIRLNAAKAILANLGPMSELAELRSRLDALELERRGAA